MSFHRGLARSIQPSHDRAPAQANTAADALMRNVALSDRGVHLVATDAEELRRFLDGHHVVINFVIKFSGLRRRMIIAIDHDAPAFRERFDQQPKRVVSRTPRSPSTVSINRASSNWSSSLRFRLVP